MAKANFSGESALTQNQFFRAYRKVLDRHIAELVQLADAIDGCPDLEEDNEDCCRAGDDMIIGNLQPGLPTKTRPEADEDREAEFSAPPRDALKSKERFLIKRKSHRHLHRG